MVSGSSAISFFGNVSSVSDRCVYSMLTGGGNTPFMLMAGFKERHRTDVSFLDHMILHLLVPKVSIHLGQGGRVQVEGEMLNLNTSQLVHGIELLKNRSELTANINVSGQVVSVLFDGYTAHISAPHATPLLGFCAGSTKLTRAVPFSSDGCEQQYIDPDNSTINCNHTTQRCKLLRSNPFTVCHTVIDPEPYISACTDILCKYPDVDGLSCQFVEAYAKSCSLQGTNVPWNWRSHTQCSAGRLASCQDNLCSDHEFCGEKYFGKSRCFCRAIFASKYRATNCLGDPTVCVGNTATLTLIGCLIEDKGVDYRLLHLNDERCKGQMDMDAHMVTFNFSSSNLCGAEVKMRGSKIIYRNTVMLKNALNNDVITRHAQIQIDFSCYYSEPDMKTTGFKIKDSSVVKQVVSGVWNYTVTMNTFTDPDLTRTITPDTEVQLNQRVWVQLRADGLDRNLVAIVTKSCWATHEPPPNGTLRYDLVVNGCPNPADDTVSVLDNGLGLSNSFSFNMFEFRGHSGQIFLHCRLELCVRQGPHSCSPLCVGGARRRRFIRSAYVAETPAFFTLSWVNKV